MQPVALLAGLSREAALLAQLAKRVQVQLPLRLKFQSTGRARIVMDGTEHHWRRGNALSEAPQGANAITQQRRTQQKRTSAHRRDSTKVDVNEDKRQNDPAVAVR